MATRAKAHSRRAKPLTANPFLALLPTVQAEVETRLLGYLDASVEAVEGYGTEVYEMADAVRDITRRGGKRLRPALVAVGATSARGDADLDLAFDAGVALELLQTYFLIHDDWMDRDETRRGGPTAHARLGKRFRSTDQGAAAAILAGDFAAGLATQALARMDIPPRRTQQVLSCFAQMQIDAVAGQQLDVIGLTKNIERTYRLKTASYTVRGPLHLGALLMGGKPRLLGALDRLSTPAGIAFQLRDDLIGVFGDPSETGKPQGSDLRAGKHTFLVETAMKRLRGTSGAAGRQALRAVLGNRKASDRQVRRALDVMESSGARQAVDDRIDTLCAEALEEARSPAISSAGQLLLQGAIEALTRRQS